MATVRTTAPRHDGSGSGNGSGGNGNGSGKKRKRSRSDSSSRALVPSSGAGGTCGTGGGSSAEMAAVRAALAGLEKWQLAVNIDMAEIRKECMQVRREVQKVEDHAELARSASEASAADARALKTSVEQQSEDVSALAKAVREEVRAVGEASAAAVADVDAMKTKVSDVARNLEALAQRSIDEEYMLTQLTALQERYDGELAKCRDDCEAMVKAKQREINALQDKLRAVESAVRAEMATADQQQAAETAKVIERVEELECSYHAGLQGVHEQLQTDVETLKDQVYAVERNLDDVRMISEQQQQQQRAPTLSPSRSPEPAPQVPLEAMTAVEVQLRVLGGDIAALRDRMHIVQRDLGDARVFIEQQQRLPPPDPRPIVPMEAFQAVENQLRRMGGDVHVVTGDFKRLTNHVDTQIGKLHEQFARRLQDLGAELFGSLSRDTNSHVAEILRLKDAMFDMQGDVRNLRRGLRQLKEQPPPRRSPPRSYEYGQRRYDEHYRYEPGRQPPPYDRGTAGFNAHGGPLHGLRRSRSRSRSRSPGRYRRQVGGQNAPVYNQHPPAPQDWGQSGSADQDRHPVSDEDRGGNEARDYGAVPATDAAPVNRIADSETAGTTGANTHEATDQSRPSDEANTWEAPTGFPHRIRPSRRQQPEVIVIEEEDEEEGEEEDMAPVEVPPNMAPPEVVLEDDIGFNREEMGVDGSEDYNTVSPSPSDTRMHSMADLNTGLLLYFCLGGAPNLDAAWTRYFYQLRSDECVDMPRALNFQRHHQFLQTLPMHLTQCVLQSVVVNASVHSATRDESPPRIEDLEPADVGARFGSLVAEIRLEWTNAVSVYLAKELAGVSSAVDKVDGALSISVNPAINSVVGLGDGITELAGGWLKRQSRALHALACAHRGGSSMQPLDRDIGVSPAVYILALLFDVVRVNTGIPQLVSLRLNAFGAKLVMHLWGLLLARLPYLFFADWTWLEDQSEPKGEIPPLGFCHVLATILMSNSLVDSGSLASEEVYKEAIDLLFRAIRVNGQAMSTLFDSSDSPEQCVPVGSVDSVSIELVNLDRKFVATLALDGCVDVCDAISGATLSPLQA